MQQAVLVLEDGTQFQGVSVGAEIESVGEVVFNTAMTGYQEILSDPSYARQIVTLTYPHIGNTGTTPQDMESSKVHCAGLIIRDLSPCSNFRSETPLGEFLRQQGIAALADIDTRRLTRHLRKNGAMRGAIVLGGEADCERGVGMACAWPGLAGMDLAKEVSCKQAYQWNEGSWALEGNFFPTPANDLDRFRVIAYDFGIKRNILRLLVDLGCQVTVVPAQTPAEEVLKDKPDGVFLSNGPGDPEPCGYAIEAIRSLLAASVPVFGICLGHQLLALASGARTVKMDTGHHGANHPVQELASGEVMISSQNHGFAVDAKSLPANVKATHISLFDGTLQGIRCQDAPAYGFQGHPEASPGPHDVVKLFQPFMDAMREYHAKA